MHFYVHRYSFNQHKIFYMNTKDPLGARGSGGVIYPEENYYMNALTFKYEIHVEIHTFKHLCHQPVTSTHILEKICRSFSSPLWEPEGLSNHSGACNGSISINHLVAPVIRFAHYPGLRYPPVAYPGLVPIMKCIGSY